MARKKIVFVLVEGPSDQQALGVILSRLFDKSSVHVEVMHGDITSDYRVAPERITAKLGDIVKQHASINHFRKDDFLQFIHLVDMDGAYIPDSAISHSPDAVRPVYSLSCIETANPKQITERNHHKQSKLNRISRLNKVWGSIPYQAYYMSCNLDHALYGKLNSTDAEKEHDAFRFAKHYRDHINDFLTFISDSDFSRMEGYRESWDYIAEGLHSLERNTNFGLCFEDIRAERAKTAGTE